MEEETAAAAATREDNKEEEGSTSPATAAREEETEEVTLEEQEALAPALPGELPVIQVAKATPTLGAMAAPQAELRPILGRHSKTRRARRQRRCPLGA